MQKELQLHDLAAYYEKSNRNVLRWIRHIDETGVWRECPKCHADKKFATRYCPDCGVRLEEEE